MGDYIILRINAGQVTANATVTPGTKTRRVSIHLHTDGRTEQRGRYTALEMVLDSVAIGAFYMEKF